MPTSPSLPPVHGRAPASSYFASRPGDAVCNGNEEKQASPDENSGMRSRRSTEDGPPSPNKHNHARVTSYASANGRVITKETGSPNGALAMDKHTKQSNAKRRSTSPPTNTSFSLPTMATTVLALVLGALIVQSLLTRQLDTKGCAMSMMRPAFAKFSDFDTEHTRFASKYSLYLYREGGIDEDTRVKGVPVLFIPGNAGSYKQVRPLAAQAAVHYHETLAQDARAASAGKMPLDFFSVDFNEDITAFHGRTLLDQAEYLNEAVAFVLSLYHNPQRSLRDPELPDPTSVILIGHSMGGIVARTMLTMPNYRANSVNTILTLAAPHAKAPVSFDADIIRTYEKINQYWRSSYAQTRAGDNPLWHVTLISIASGGLDTVVPADYATTASLVPPTHGFTVFTSTIPNVWTSMDHLAITWCDQLRKSVVPALYDAIDANRPSQTRPRAERMSAFKNWLLTGLEDNAEKRLLQEDSRTLLTLEDDWNDIVSQGERLALATLGQTQKAKAYLLPVPPSSSQDRRQFRLLTDQNLGTSHEQDKLQVMFCSILTHHSWISSNSFSVDMNLSSNSSTATRLACKNAASDVITLPRSTHQSRHPFEHVPPFSFLQYDVEDLVEHQFVAIIDRANLASSGWLVAEFWSKADAIYHSHSSISDMVTSGIHVALPSDRPMVTEIRIPAAHSSLLAYKVAVLRQGRSKSSEKFAPLLRQYISDPYESKFFVNVGNADVSLHGIAPFMPTVTKSHTNAQGLSLQLWADPTCDNTLELSMTVDILGSMGKLWMRYRTIFAAFPLVIVALVLRKQFQLYEESDVFVTFATSMDQCLRSSIPLSFTALTIFSLLSSQAGSNSLPVLTMILGIWRSDVTETPVDYTRNDLFLGLPDPFFWFLLPLFGVISVGVCVLFNCIVSCVIYISALLYSASLGFLTKNASARISDTFAITSLRKRIITTSILLILVSTFIPYQFVFIVLCIVQIATCIRALCLARLTNNASNDLNFANYVHSILMLLLCILPINIPVLVVWIHNISLHWLTPFSSHHNVLAIMPFVVLVETLSTGRMIPRHASSWFTKQTTSLLFMSLAAGAVVYGISYAYLLHFWVNFVVSWLVVLHVSGHEQIKEMTKKVVGGSKSAPATHDENSATHFGVRVGVGVGAGTRVQKRP